MLIKDICGARRSALCCSFPLQKHHLPFCPAFSCFLFTPLPRQSLWCFCHRLTEMHLNDPLEPAAKATVRLAGRAAEGGRQPGPSPRHHAPCPTAGLCAPGPRPPTWAATSGLQQNRTVVKKPTGWLTPSTDSCWIHRGISTHRRLFIFFTSFTGSVAKALNTAFYPS